MYIDLYLSFSNITNYWRWEKDYRRITELKRLFPIKEPTDYTADEPSPETDSIITEVLNYIGNINESIVLTGIAGYNMYPDTDKLPVHFIDIYHADPGVLAEKLRDHINDTVNVNMEYEHSESFMGHYPECYRVYVDDISIVNIYDSRELHIVTKKMKGEPTDMSGEFTFLVPCFDHIMYNLHASLVLHCYFEEDQMYKLTKKAIVNLNNAQKIWNDNNGLIGIEPNNPYQILIDSGYDYRDSFVYQTNVKYANREVETRVYRPELSYIADNDIDEYHY